MRKSPHIALTLAAFLVVGPAKAQLDEQTRAARDAIEAIISETHTFLNGNLLLEYCTNPDMSDVCSGFTMGVADAASWVSQINPAYMPFRACFPHPITPPQVRDVVVRYLQAHPRERQYAAVDRAWKALAEAWPCPRQ